MADPNRPLAPLVATKTHWLAHEPDAGANGAGGAEARTANVVRALPRSSVMTTGWAASCSPHPSGFAAANEAHSDSRTFVAAPKPRI